MYGSHWEKIDVGHYWDLWVKLTIVVVQKLNDHGNMMSHFSLLGMSVLWFIQLRYNCNIP